jgi:prophage regulatory protein
VPRRRKQIKRNTNPIVPETGFIRLPGVLAVIPVSKASWYAGIKKGLYPRPVSLGPNTRAWAAEDIRALITRIRGNK